MSTTKSAEYWIQQLKLKPHPEGGYYRETYRAGEDVSSQHLPGRFGGTRSFSTAIYFLLRSQDRSLFHRIKSDELWHFHAGSSLTIICLDKTGVQKFLLGNNPENHESLQVIIPANTWFGAIVNQPDSYVLAGCTVAPGFDFQDFEMATRDELFKEFPGHESVITALTKE